MNLTDNIIELNRDMEPFVVQAGSGRPVGFKDEFKPLQFVHFSDIHTALDLWNRVAEYVNHYKEYISFGIHTGDYCGNNQELYADCYNYGVQCERPLYNCTGNHDVTVTRKHLPASKESVYKKLFAPQPDITQDVKFMDIEYSMTYYKDFTESNIRMIVLDLYYDVEEQKTWLAGVLADAKEKGLSVITAMHEPTGHIEESFGVTFHSIMDYSIPVGKQKVCAFESLLTDFIANGGKFICNLAGHHHHDLFGITEAGILNICVPSATNWDGWCDGRRVKGTRTYDCFNVMAIDVNLGILKLIRIGDNCDPYLREKKVLCFDYINNKVIYN